jgi:hypothetical protein
MKKYIFFDLDDTLTPSRAEILPETIPVLRELIKDREVIVVSGAQTERIINQVGKEFEDKIWLLAQNGNHAAAPGGKQLWYDEITDQSEIINHISKLQTLLDSINDDMIEHRGCQISFSCVGQHADLALKRKFDPDFSKRRSMLGKFPFDSENYEVRIGGTTNFDYFKKDKHKGTNVRRLAEAHGWDMDHCLYIGDAIFPGGNDEAVIGICDTRLVSGPHETIEVIKEILS